MADNTESKITALVDIAMRQRGWLTRQLSRQMTTYLMAIPVTPYFTFTGLEKRQDDHYVVRGGIGVLHRDFEALWASQHRESATDAHSFVFMVDMTNFIRIARLSLIGGDAVREEVFELCAAIDDVLIAMPSTDYALRREIGQAVIAGISARHFFNPIDSEKTAAFRNFLG